MYRILVVDDEKWIRKGIISILDRKRFNICEIIEAENAVEAQELFETFEPHILICDVCMPVKDGCTFCEEIMEKYPMTKIIMISGYNEFSYVQRALKYGAADYILKPLNREEMNEAVGKAVNDIENDVLMRQLTENSLVAMENMFMQYILYQSESVLNQIKAMTSLNIGEFNVFFLITVEYNSKEYEGTFFKNTVQNVLQDCFNEHYSSVSFMMQNNYICSIIFLKGQNQDLEITVRRLIAGLQQNNIFQFFVSHSDLCSDIKYLPQEYDKTVHQLDERKVSDSICSCTATSNNIKILDSYAAMSKNVLQAVEIRNSKKLHEAFNDMYMQFRTDAEMSIKTARFFFMSLLYDCIGLLMKDKYFEKKLLKEGVTRSGEIDDCYDIMQMIMITQEFAQKVIDRKDEISQSDVQRIVREVIEYIGLNYQEEISLNDIAAKYYINSSYFSHMFKEITGESFINYLTEVRIERAAEMLENTDLKVSEVGNLVGYNDSRYFCKVFKKVKGVVPTQYRMGSDASDKKI